MEPKIGHQDFGPHLTIVLKKMCEWVGADYSIVNMTPEWYREYFWTEEQEEGFKLWMVNYLYTTTAARKEMMSFSRKNKRNCKEATNWFLFMYGWKTMYEKEDLTNGKV